ncbi:MAG TPA: efflux RND transporter periplasmic adaptor subunit [Gammaproteobacteria bacterium]
MTAPEPVIPLERRLDGGMDRRIERRRFTWPRLAAGLTAAGLVAAAIYELVATSGVRSFAIASELLTIATVETGTFHDFVPIRGTVTPLDTVYLDAIEGGRVEKVFVEEGALVEAGEPILELSNTALQLDVISREAQVSEQLNNLRNTRLAMEQNRLSLKSTLIEIDYQITRLARLAERRAELFERNLIARQDYEDVLDELEYYRNRREVTIESQQADERMRLAQIESLESTVAQLERNLEIARANLDNLVIRAPIAGQLTSLDAEIGESKGRGQRLGQIDDVDDFKVTAQVDEFYVTRMRANQSAEFDLAGETYRLEVTKVYPEIRDGQFQIDLEFVGEPPRNLRRGQTLQIRVALGDSSEALLLPRGGFFQDTGGNWAFVLDESGEFAEKRTLRLGRRNPEYFEVLEGLEPGDRVITSAYTSFVDMDRLELRD